jgi:hypothetical protein
MTTTTTTTRWSAGSSVGPYALNPVHPELESAWFQPWSLICDLRFLKICFHIQLVPLHLGGRGGGGGDDSPASKRAKKKAAPQKKGKGIVDDDDDDEVDDGNHGGGLARLGERAVAARSLPAGYSIQGGVAYSSSGGRGRGGGAASIGDRRVKYSSLPAGETISVLAQQVKNGQGWHLFTTVFVCVRNYKNFLCYSAQYFAVKTRFN